jgi:hypothetical protein
MRIFFCLVLFCGFSFASQTIEPYIAHKALTKCNLKINSTEFRLYFLPRKYINLIVFRKVVGDKYPGCIYHALGFSTRVLRVCAANPRPRFGGGVCNVALLRPLLACLQKGKLAARRKVPPPRDRFFSATIDFFCAINLISRQEDSQ